MTVPPTGAGAALEVRQSRRLALRVHVYREDTFTEDGNTHATHTIQAPPRAPGRCELPDSPPSVA